MKKVTRNIFGYAEEAIQRLVQECRLGGPLSNHGRQTAALVRRSGNWLLNDLTGVRQKPEQSRTQENEA
jgi:hypothetical protein